MSEKELNDKIVIGVLKNVVQEEYTAKYFAMISNIKEPEDLRNLDASAYSAVPMKSSRYECRLSGSGGQGLLLAGIIFSEAMIRQGKNAVHTQSYGPEARGGASRSEVVISDGDINFPDVSSPDTLLAMTQDSFDKFSPGVKKGGVILSDSTFVKTKPVEGVLSFEYPISDYAKNTLGEIRAANIVALGLLCGIHDFIAKEAMWDAILSRLPSKTHELNKMAFEYGIKEGCALLSKVKKVEM
jgi:2-oxoglutarate ferredoxin oxidoreductase subunit gamma